MKLRTLALLALVVAACSKPPPTESASPAAAPVAPAPVAAANGKLAWTDPPAWARRPGSNPMRVAEYGVPNPDANGEQAECVVTTFGAGQGGSPEANIDRWVRQFDPESAGAVKKSDRNVASMKVTTVELAGTYRGMAMPGGPGAAPSAKKGYRMVAAIVDAPGGAYFFKLTGPDAAVNAARPAFEALLDSLRR